MKRKSSLKLPFWAVDRLVASALQRDLAAGCLALEGRLLDLGCGNSPYRPFLVRISDYLGYDIDALGGEPQIVGAADRLPFASQSFDSILCTQVIEHVPEPWRVVEEAHRVLRPGGKLLLSAPQAWRLHEKPHDYYRFTRYGLEHLVRRAGLAMISCHEQGGAWRLIGQAMSNTFWRGHYRRGTASWLIARVAGALGSSILNAIAPVMDRIFYDPDDTLNYVVLAQRPTETES